MQKAMQEIISSNKDFFVLGGGSNSLVLDDYYDGHVIVTSLMNKLEIEDTYIRVGAGVDNSAVSTIALENKLSEYLGYIVYPVVSGALYNMNAGAMAEKSVKL